MTEKPMTSRRSFLKAGAIVAAPLAAVAAPAAAALAGDRSSERLARIEDERAIEALNRDLARQVSAGGSIAGLAEPGLVGLAFDPGAEPAEFTISADRTRASVRMACSAEFEREFEGQATLVQMARLQGNGAVRVTEARSFVGSYLRRRDGWRIERIELA
ncbi:MAG: hypothetical protein J7496_10930 [Novosphingobium sp.]|nr:hypothetical protein [Novosphingobium sp.]MBO9603007.1 hypothetical protein [Novosphingobium sp.]